MIESQKNKSDNVANYFYGKKRNKATKRNIKESKICGVPNYKLEEKRLKESFRARLDEDPGSLFKKALKR